MSDFFNEAYRHARSRFTAEQWLVLAPQQVTRAIYDAMRELDAVRVSQPLPRPRERPPKASRRDALAEQWRGRSVPGTSTSDSMNPTRWRGFLSAPENSHMRSPRSSAGQAGAMAAVRSCLARAGRFGIMGTLKDTPRSGRQPEITPQARAWVVSLACQKAKDLGYPHELWTTRLLASHVREQAPAAGYACVARIGQGTLCKILTNHAVKPHKVRYYPERRDAEFDARMADRSRFMETLS